MKILEITLSDSRGGAETVMHNISECLIKEGLRVKTFILEECVKYFDDLGEGNFETVGSFLTFDHPKTVKNKLINTFYIYLDKIKKSFTKNPFNKKFISNIKNKIDSYKPDIIHLHLPEALKLVLCIEFKCPVVFTIHGDMELNKIFYSLKSFLDKFLLKLALKKIKNFTSACNYFYDIIEDVGIPLSNKNAIIIPNGIFLDQLSNIKPLELNGRFKMIFVGGTRHKKGGDLLIRALPIIKKKIPNFKLYILRDVPENHFIKKFVAKNSLLENVSFIGYANYPDYFRYIKSVDIAILPSRTEGIAQALLEFLACGKPIVATNVGGTPEIIKDKENGVLINPNPKSVARGILELYNNKTLRDKISKQNLKKAKNFDWNEIIKQYIKFFIKISKIQKLK